MLLAFEPRGHAHTPTITSRQVPKARRRSRRAREVVTPGPAAVEFTWANRRPGTAGFARWTAAVGQRIDEHGFAAATSEVENLVATARRLGVAAVATNVLVDSAQPDVARQRAFAHVVSALVTTPAPITA